MVFVGYWIGRFVWLEIEIICRELELQLGRSVITSKNAAQLNHVVTQMIEASVNAADDGEE